MFKEKKILKLNLRCDRFDRSELTLRDRRKNVFLLSINSSQLLSGEFSHSFDSL